MDESKFLKNERPNEYEVLFQVTGEYRATITAESLEAARAEASEMVARKEIELDAEDIEHVEITHLWKSHPLFLVTRDGQTMQVSRLDEGDLPRQPTEHGF